MKGDDVSVIVTHAGIQLTGVGVGAETGFSERTVNPGLR